MNTIKHFLKANALLILIVAIGFVVALRFVNPAPPKSLTIAAGAKDGRYYQLAEQLKASLARQGITLKVLATEGSVANLNLLTKADGDVSLALVQSGVERLYSGDTHELSSLGSLYYEPLWIFYRTRRSINLISDLRGLRVAIGTAGSGTNAMARFLLQANGLNSPGALRETLDVGTAESADDLADGKVDAAFFVLPANHPIIRRLVNESGIDFLSMRRAAAYEGNFPFLSTVPIGEGLIDLKTDKPESNRRVLASLATLVINDRFHPALTPLILESLQHILRGGGVLEKPGQFPSPNHVGFPITAEARHFYRQGPPFLQRFLPFWVASLVDRLVILVIPFMALLVPLVKLAGPVYRWRIRARIYRWYRFLRDVDQKMIDGQLQEVLDAEITRLRDLQSELSAVDVPLSYTDNLYELRMHVNFVIARLEAMKAREPAGQAAAEAPPASGSKEG